MEVEQKKFNDLTREFLEEFISKLPKADKKNLKEYIQNHPRNSSSSMFAMVKSYIYNNYFRATPAKDGKNKAGTFAETLDILLMDDDNEQKENNL